MAEDPWRDMETDLVQALTGLPGDAVARDDAIAAVLRMVKRGNAQCLADPLVDAIHLSSLFEVRRELLAEGKRPRDADFLHDVQMCYCQLYHSFAQPLSAAHAREPPVSGHR